MMHFPEVIPTFGATYRLRAYDARTGRLVYDSGPIRNLVVNTGKTLMLQRIFGLPSGNVPAALSVIGIGTDSTAPAVNQTKLNPVVAGSSYLQTVDSGTTISGLTCNIQATMATGVGNFTIAEVGLFNGLTNGASIMYSRAPVTPAFTKSASLTLVVQVSLTQN